jgi:hypothetical protein
MRAAFVWLLVAAAAACGGDDDGGTMLSEHSMRFMHGGGDPPFGDYGVVIPVAGHMANVGAGDFTIELWLKAEPDSLLAWGGCRGGLREGTSWLAGHVVLDRSQAGQPSFIGLSLFGDAIAFGVGDQNYVEGGVCEPAYFNSGDWHHIAAVRAGSTLRVFVDGDSTRALADLEAGDMSYQGPDTPESAAILGGWKARNTVAPWRGWIDELRISTVARYPDSPRPEGPLEADSDTALLYHFDTIQGTTVIDSSLADPLDGTRASSGDQWQVVYDDENPFY